jgi:phosphohistidine phosphatase SixA
MLVNYDYIKVSNFVVLSHKPTMTETVRKLNERVSHV